MVKFLEVKGAGTCCDDDFGGLMFTVDNSRMLVAQEIGDAIAGGEDAAKPGYRAGTASGTQYVWAPNGEQLCFGGAKFVSWFDLKTQAAAGTLLAGETKNHRRCKNFAGRNLCKFLCGSITCLW